MKNLISIILILFATACHDTSRIVDKPLPDACISFEETCNSIDDDCDGKIDEQEDIAIKPCYEGDYQTLLYGICRFGVERCVDGGMVCTGQIKPEQEICNNIDDNCNGQTDEVRGAGLDLIFIIDYSSSMADKLRMINDILLQWSSSYANRTDIKVALVGAPTDNVLQDQQVIILLPLSDVTAFIAEAISHPYAFGGGSEPVLDAIYFLSDRRNPMGINWTPDYSRALLVFTDELPQSYATPRVSEIDAKNMALINNVNVYIFTNDFAWRNWTTFPINSLQSLSNSIDQAIQRGMCK